MRPAMDQASAVASNLSKQDLGLFDDRVHPVAARLPLGGNKATVTILHREACTTLLFVDMYEDIDR